MQVSDRQARVLLMEHSKTDSIGKAAMKADMDRKTAAKYIHDGRLPSARPINHSWNTREDPFEVDWEYVVLLLDKAPELQAKALFEHLCERRPGVYHEGQLRTLQRRIRRWRAMSGPPREVFFPQVHVPGARMQTDFTCGKDLGITIGGEAFLHLLCHSVLTYSNWEWATICHSESFIALRTGLQEALKRIDHIPVEHWTDHSCSVTHEPGTGGTGRRAFNKSYLELMSHFGITPRTINPGRPNENGDVESQNNAIKQRIRQHLLLRGGGDFDSVEEYRLFLEAILHKANNPRHKRLIEELDAMRPLTAPFIPAYIEEHAFVSRNATVQTDRKTYSVPARLIGERVRLRRYEDRIEVWYGGALQETMPRLCGSRRHAINYRHVIDWLVRKPGAFERYRFREEMFPTEEFRAAYDRLRDACGEREANVDYLRLLRRAAHDGEAVVARAIAGALADGCVPRFDIVAAPVPGTGEAAASAPPAVRIGIPDVCAYDQLLAMCRDVVESCSSPADTGASL